MNYLITLGIPTLAVAVDVAFIVAGTKSHYNGRKYLWCPQNAK
jgi:hypothetical protein